METQETTIQSRLEYFDSYYGLLVDCNLTGDKERTIYSSEPRVCRFCGRSESQTTFRKKAHAFPELIGNRVLILAQECDFCNEHFSKYLENHLANFLGPGRTFSLTRGKSGVPSIKTADKSGRIDVRDSVFNVETQLGSSLYSEDEKEKLITFNTTKPSYIPNGVFKALTKMALSILPPTEMENYRETAHWLLQTDHNLAIMKPQPVYFSFRGGYKPYPFIKAMILKSKSSEFPVPYLQFYIAFDNYTFQIPIFGIADRQRSNKHLLLQPLPTIYELQEADTLTTYSLVDMSSGESIKNTKVEIQMSYTDRDVTFVDNEQ